MASESAEAPTQTQERQTAQTSTVPVESQVTPTVTPGTSEVKPPGPFRKLLNLFGGKSKEPEAAAQANQGPSVENQQQLRDRLADLQARRLNIEKFMNAPDSTGSSKIRDTKEIGRIDQKIVALKAKLPPETATGQGQVEVPFPPSTGQEEVSSAPTITSPSPTEEEKAV